MRISISRKFVEGLGYRVVTKKGGVIVGYYGSIPHTIKGFGDMEGVEIYRPSRKAVTEAFNDAYLKMQAETRNSL